MWARRDRTPWPTLAIRHRRNCTFVCKYGNLGVSIDEVRKWPISRLREQVQDIMFWLDVEKKNSKR